MATSFDGQRIRLTVDGAWLADARFAVILDPLTTRVKLRFLTQSLAAGDIEIGYEEGSSIHNTMVVFKRV